MSWDVLLMRIPPDINTLEELEEEYEEKGEDWEALGSREEVLSLLPALLPEADFSDPTWGSLTASNFSIEFNIGDGDPIETIMLHIRGGEGSTEVIRKICTSTEWSAIDCVTNKVIDFSTDSS